MNFVTPLVLPELHDRFQTPLAVGIVLVFLVHCFFLDRYALPALPLRQHTRFATAVATAFLVFVGAALAAYEWLLPTLVNRAFDEATPSILLVPSWSSYFPLACGLCFGAGLFCEFLVAVVLFGLLAFLDYRSLAKARPFLITVILIVAAVAAPSPDPFWFLAISLPILALCEAAIWIVFYAERRRDHRPAPENIHGNLAR